MLDSIASLCCTVIPVQLVPDFFLVDVWKDWNDRHPTQQTGFLGGPLVCFKNWYRKLAKSDKIFLK
jgi:hypothetical protein